MSDITAPEKQEIARDEEGKFVPGVSGNPNGRPKRKTLTELIHEKLDKTPNGWEDLVDILLTMAKRKDKDILKELWHYTDGMPTQRNELTGKDGKPIIPLVIEKVYDNKTITLADKGKG